MSFLNRSFTRREIILLLVLALLLILGLYFYAVHYPIVNRTAEIDEEMDDVLFRLDVAKTRQGIYNSMKTELDEIFKLPEDELTVMPEYSNFQTLLNRFNTIFDGHEPVLSFDTVTFNGNIAARTVRFTFLASDWEEGREILSQLTSTGYRCLLDSLSFTSAGGDTNREDFYVESSPLKISGSITFYELVS